MIMSTGYGLGGPEPRGPFRISTAQARVATWSAGHRWPSGPGPIRTRLSDTRVPRRHPKCCRRPAASPS